MIRGDGENTINWSPPLTRSSITCLSAISLYGRNAME
jgi:hypothetical protein